MRLVLLFCLSSLSLLRGDLLSEAMQTFPANTTALEYDNLAALRQLPNYPELRKQYSGEALRRAKETLAQLGIAEDQLSQVATASGPAGFFGLVAGTLQRAAISPNATAQHFSRTTLAQGPAYCSPGGVCVLLPSARPEIAAFGPLEQLRALEAVHNGQSAAVNTNSSWTTLLKGLDTHAPVIGFAPGSELTALLSSVVPQQLASHLDLPHWAANIEEFAYSIKIDTEAHVVANVLCTSESASKLLSGALNAASNLQRMTAAVAGNSLPYRNLTATPNGKIVTLRLDAKLTS